MGADRRVAIGLDLGGSKIAAGLVAADGVVIEHSVRGTPAAEGPIAVLDALVSAAVNLIDAARLIGAAVEGVGVASAGIVNPGSGRVAAVTDALPGWSEIPVVSRLSASVGIPVVLINDVHAMAIGEGAFGAGRDVSDVLYLAVGTGIGGAIARDGVVLEGSHGAAGDVGHVVVDIAATAPLCGCGRRGHLEAYVSGPSLARTYEERVDSADVNLDLRTIADRASSGDADAASVLSQGGTLLGRVIGGLTNLLDPDLVVFGGGLLALGPLFWPFFEDALGEEVRAPNAVPRCEPALLGNEAALVGAAMLALRSSD
ncbi:MAG: putative sugar kinase [Acidimicrobiaceae bacterium]|jgi:glucokinase|nr:putative sugar kinase [Acidimicrobiaceae bacterium]